MLDCITSLLASRLQSAALVRESAFCQDSYPCVTMLFLAWVPYQNGHGP